MKQRVRHHSRLALGLHPACATRSIQRRSGASAPATVPPGTTLARRSCILRSPHQTRPSPHPQDAAVSTAHAAAESQRAKVLEVQQRLKLAYEDERERKSLQSRLTALQQELDRRDRVAKQTSEAAAYARTQLTMHKNAAAAFALEQQRLAEKKQKVGERGWGPAQPARWVLFTRARARGLF